MDTAGKIRENIENVMKKNKAFQHQENIMTAVGQLQAALEHVSPQAADIMLIQQKVPNDLTADVAEMLEEYIQKLANDTTDEDDAVKTLTYVQVYCHLSFLKDDILDRKVKVMDKSGCDEGDVKALKNLIENNTDKCRQVIRFIRHPENIKQAMVSSVYSSSEWPEIEKHLTIVNVERPPQPVAGQQVDLRVNAFPWWYCYTKTPSGILSTYDKGRDTNIKTGVFTFEKADEDYWYICQSGSNDTRWYSDGQWKCGQGESTPIKVTVTTDKKWLLSGKHTPDSFLYVDFTNKIRSKQGDPDTAGYWEICPV